MRAAGNSFYSKLAKPPACMLCRRLSAELLECIECVPNRIGVVGAEKCECRFVWASPSVPFLRCTNPVTLDLQRERLGDPVRYFHRLARSAHPHQKLAA